MPEHSVLAHAHSLVADKGSDLNLDIVKLRSLNERDPCIPPFLKQIGVNFIVFSMLMLKNKGFSSCYKHF